MPSNCKDYEEGEDGEAVAGSGRAHVIFKSFYNLHDYYNRLRNAIDDCKMAFGTLQGLFAEYYPAEDLEDEALATLLGSLDTVFGLAADVSGSDKLGTASSLFSSLTETLSDALVHEGETIDHVADLTEYVPPVWFPIFRLGDTY